MILKGEPHKRKKKKCEPLLLSQIHSRESRSSDKISGDKRSASKVILSNNNQTEDLFGDLPDSVFSNISTDGDIKKLNFANPRRDTFAQFEYSKTNKSQNDTNKDFAEPCTEGKEVMNNLEIHPQENHKRGTMTSWINEQSAFHDCNGVAAGESVIEYLDKPPKKPRTELKNRNYDTILLPNKHGQSTGGAYGASNNEMLQTDGAYDASNNNLFPIGVANNVNFTNCIGNTGKVKPSTMQSPNVHGGYFSQVQVSDNQHNFYPHYGNEQMQDQQAQRRHNCMNTNNYQHTTHPVVSPRMHHEQEIRTGYSHGRHVKRISFEDAFS